MPILFESTREIAILYSIKNSHLLKKVLRILKIYWEQNNILEFTFIYNYKVPDDTDHK